MSRFCKTLLFLSYAMNFQAIHTFLGEENIKAVINFALKYIADLDIPVKRSVLYFSFIFHCH